mmetsp:Transcript_1212/g.2293  ORF Transcript_1212/g.2293 Transcript_1212/m.2293 type:complete len:201 (-) Transcript_1212:2588-3190(-)
MAQTLSPRLQKQRAECPVRSTSISDVNSCLQVPRRSPQLCQQLRQPNLLLQPTQRKHQLQSQQILQQQRFKGRSETEVKTSAGTPTAIQASTGGFGYTPVFHVGRLSNGNIAPRPSKSGTCTTPTHALSAKLPRHQLEQNAVPVRVIAEPKLATQTKPHRDLLSMRPPARSWSMRTLATVYMCILFGIMAFFRLSPATRT